MEPLRIKSTFLVSACLVGLCTRYDGLSKANEECIGFLKNHNWIPVCPEQLGGLPTPRPAADIIEGDGDDVLKGTSRVLTQEGQDVSSRFILGAQQVLLIAKQQQVNGACLKSRSPSCSVNGTIGVTAALLVKNNIPLYEF